MVKITMEPKKPSIAVKEFTFEDVKKAEFLSVSIPEVLDPQYGMYAWPCAAVLARYLWTQREELTHRSVLELGAGVSLPGVVAALCGAQVILSDNARIPLCVENCRRSCDVNGLNDVVVMGLTWGQISPDLVLLPKLDLILGSDVFYEPQDFEDVLVTVAFLLRKNPSAQFWTTYQERSADWSIEELLHRWKLKCVEVQLEDSDEDEWSPEDRHSVHMMKICEWRTEGAILPSETSST